VSSEHFKPSLKTNVSFPHVKQFPTSLKIKINLSFVSFVFPPFCYHSHSHSSFDIATQHKSDIVVISILVQLVSERSSECQVRVSVVSQTISRFFAKFQIEINAIMWMSMSMTLWTLPRKKSSKWDCWFWMGTLTVCTLSRLSRETKATIQSSSNEHKQKSILKLTANYFKVDQKKRAVTCFKRSLSLSLSLSLSTDRKWHLKRWVLFEMRFLRKSEPSKRTVCDSLSLLTFHTKEGLCFNIFASTLFQILECG
jgi:hypothetical protein